MNTHFPIPTDKPFRGITKIQLFDKNGEMIEEVVHENTYNQRIQFRNYLDTILHCKTPDMSKQLLFALTGSDEATNGTYSDNLSYETIWDTGSTSTTSVRQPFATLWLTNATANEAANGYPNGIPVALADSSGVANNIVNIPCAGQPNIQESYYGADRLHLVFDFDTVHGNITFDSLWLYPSRYRSGSTGSNCYHVLPFFQKQCVKRQYDLSFNIPFQFKYVYQERLNGPYSMLWFSDSTRSNNGCQYVGQVIVFNQQTGEIVANCTFSTLTRVYGSFYYDAGSNQLYMLHNSAYTGDVPFSGGSASNSFCLIKINLTTGDRTFVANMNTLLNMVKSNYNYAGDIANWRYNVDVYWLAGENTTIIAVPTEGTDASTGQQSGYYTWFTFNPLTESFDFVKRQKVYTGTVFTDTSISPNYSNRGFVRDGRLYLACFISPNVQTYNNYAVFNIKTGALLYDKALSYRSSLYSPVVLTSESFWAYYDSKYIYSRAQKDDLIYRNATRRLTSNTSASAKLRIERYDTALWSTHNKLTSAITKTDQTTMKIQYDIIWDSLNDVIIPGLM